MKKNNNRKTYMIAMIITIMVIIISITIPLRVNKNEVTPVQITQENNGLPKLENFENLYNIVMSNKKNNLDITNIQGESIAKETRDSLNDTTNNLNEDYSSTNIQVQGVDESDIVKTDGEYIYYVANECVQIIKEENKMKLIKKINYEEEEFTPKEIYVTPNKLIVIGLGSKMETDDFRMRDMLYKTNEKTIVKTYNIENKTKPKMERQIVIEGSYLSSRMIDNNIYVISNQYLSTYNFKENIEEMNQDDYKPKYIDTLISKEEQSIEYNDIAYFPESDDISYLTILSFNTNKKEKANIETFLGAGDNIYCSLNNLYIANVKYQYKDEKIYGYYNNYDLNTYIYKFKLENSQAIYLNVGSVPGSILNQFSMDEKDGNFRIATTNNTNFNSDTNVNNLYILDENLNIVGSLENLAKGERIYSVRFMDNRAYMVTFVQTDPLFVIDLSDNLNPVVLGELKIPGYSKYLHPYDETHIIGFGENTITNENGGVITDGMKMALFDVSNPSNPIEMYSQDIGERGTNSEILYNHKALLFLKEKNIIAFPIYIKENVEEYRTNLKFQGAIVYEIDLENGFVEKGKIAHKEIQNEVFEYDYTNFVERMF